MSTPTKKILGLDLGTNSIGWALTEQDLENKHGKILGMGARIIPMGAELNKFEQGQAQTKNADRRIARGMRKQNKRYKQRRNKLIYVLQKLGMLPDQIKLSAPFTDPLKIDKICILPIDKKQKQYSALDLLELRVKALSQEISLKELGRIIYLHNQLRGYAGGGNEPEEEKDKDDEENTNEERKGNESYITSAKIVSISAPETITYKNKQRKKVRVKIVIEEGVELEGESFLETLNLNETLELQVNIRKSKQGKTITFKLPVKTNWRKKMENLEQRLSEASEEKGSEVYLCQYFASILKENNWAKIRNNVILRSRYQSEFDAIWKEQSKHHPILNSSDRNLLSEILQFIFPGNTENQSKFREIGLEKGLYQIIRNQIIYFQRELKDQTHLISNCRFEPGEKVVAKSHPVFQEHKLWEQINKLTINTKTEKGPNRKGEMKYAYEDKPIPAKVKEWLYDELQQKKEISFTTILAKLKKEQALRDGVDFLNGINPKAKLSGNETKALLKKMLGETLWQQLNLQDELIQIQLWDILFNCKGNEYDLESERTSKVLDFLKIHSKDAINLEQLEQTAIKISKIKFSRNYASLSLTAIEKILPLARAGKHFNRELSAELREKIIRLLNETVEDPFEKSVQDFLEKNQNEVLTSGGILNTYATILIYNRHTAKEYGSNEQIKSYKEIKRLQPGELRNPLVEQLISETLMMVRDIWRQFGAKPDEIRIELARDLKNNAERRAKIYESNRKNQKANEEVKNLLFELNQELTITNIEKYKLWESQENLKEEYIKQYQDASKSEVEKMRLWKEQGHISPYSGQPIPLSELFNRERYDIDHIIPQSRYFDDSFGNKVICEKSINKDKGNKTAMEYFEAGSSTIRSVLSKIDYIDLVNKYFNGIKRKNLFATSVPQDPITRQIKETQYISVRVKEELNKIVGNDNVKTTTGGVTDYLRNQWGLTDKFKNILLERYKKAQPLLAENEYEKYEKTFDEKKKEREKNSLPFNEMKQEKEQFVETYNKNFTQFKNNKLIIKDWSKRVDHRHHAIDALVISCTEPKHIKRLNDLNKELQTWLDKNRKDILPNFEGSPSELLDEILNLDSDKRESVFKQIERFKNIEMPWKGFPEAAGKAVCCVIVSQKPKDKLLIQKDKAGEMQIKIRGQLHKGTIYGKTQGVESYRIPLSKLAGTKFATEKTIEKITDEFLKSIIAEHLKDFGDKKDAFSAEGILNLNKKLEERKRKSKNGEEEPAPHPPVSSIKIFYRDPTKIKKKKNEEEPKDALQRLDRRKAFNESLYVKTGDNYLFAVMEKDGKRVYDVITLFDAVNLLKEEFNKEGVEKSTFSKDIVFKTYFEQKNKGKLLFTLRQGDPVYLPEKDEQVVTDKSDPRYADFWGDKEERSRNIHFVTQYSGTQIYFIKHNIAHPILKQKEFGTQNAYEKLHGLSIKKSCIKLSIDRLGNIKPA